MADSLSVRIRMYRKGFGDRFLLTFTEAARTFHMLIDCGVLKGTKNPEVLMEEIVQDIKKETKDTLDLLVVTHEHWDHISGFHQAKQTWDAIKVNEVWMAWTEDRNKPLAQKLHDNRQAKQQMLQSILSSQQLAANGLFTSLLFTGEVEDDASSTRAAMLYAASKAAGNVKFHDPGALASLNGIEGVRIYVLGPPANLELLQDQPSTTNSEVYLDTRSLNLTDTFLAAVAQRAAPDADPIELRALPFEKDYKEREPRDSRFFREHYFGGADGELMTWRRIDDDWIDTGSALGLSIGADTNNTSLALAIELTASGQVLLFPGDAQVGNWLSWSNYTWGPDQANGPPHEVKIEELLNRTVFYKVGHHGSQNATLSDKGLALMGKNGLVAMIPVDEDMCKQQGRKLADGTHEGWPIPYDILLNNLKHKTHGRVIRADTKLPTRADAAAFFAEAAAHSAEAAALLDAEWAQFEQAADEPQEGLYIDYTITG
jgi:hypothetical protein